MAHHDRDHPRKVVNRKGIGKMNLCDALGRRMEIARSAQKHWAEVSPERSKFYEGIAIAYAHALRLIDEGYE